MRICNEKVLAMVMVLAMLVCVFAVNVAAVDNYEPKTINLVVYLKTVDQIVLPSSAETVTPDLVVSEDAPADASGKITAMFPMYGTFAIDDLTVKSGK